MTGSKARGATLTLTLVLCLLANWSEEGSRFAQAAVTSGPEAGKDGAKEGAGAGDPTDGVGQQAAGTSKQPEASEGAAAAGVLIYVIIMIVVCVLVIVLLIFLIKYFAKRS